MPAAANIASPDDNNFAAPPGPERSRQLELFEQHVPDKPWCTDDFAYGLRVLPKRAALRRREIQPQVPWERWHLLFDVDRDGAWCAHDEADPPLPAPTWTAVNPRNGHGHLGYSLRDPVLIGPGNQAKPQQYAVRVERALRVLLRADRSFSGFLTHNPTHRHWAVIGSGYVFELVELHEAVGDLREYREPERTAGLGRNVDSFNAVRERAYRMVREYWRPDGGAAFLAWCERAVIEHTETHHRPPLDRRECRQIGRSIGRWVWERFAPSGWREWHVKRGKASGTARRKAVAARNAEIRRLHVAGMRQTEIAALVAVHRNTVAKVLQTHTDAHEMHNELYQV